MPLNIRKAAAGDAPAWLELLKVSFGEDYPEKQVYDPAWVVAQLEQGGETETWVAEENGELHSALSLLPPSFENNNPVANLGRHLNSPTAFNNGAAEALLRQITTVAEERKQVVVSRVLSSDHPLQLLYENAGFFCIGFQPFKHLARVREGTLFYYRMGQHDLAHRLSISDSLPQVTELAALVLANLNIVRPSPIRDGVTGYPLQSELEFSDGTLEDFELWKMQAQLANPPVELSGAYNQGAGFLRTTAVNPHRSVLALKGGTIIAGVLYTLDSVDRCVRLIDSFSQDDVAMGPTMAQAVKVAHQDHSAVYLEMDVLITAPRLLKSAEQLGFVPVAYFPAIYAKAGNFADVVKLVKLNMVYSLEAHALTAEARRVVTVIDHQFQDQKMGVAIINLLRELPFFGGLGDGELRKISRLFTQKLYRPGEKIFSKGDTGEEAFVVMRGQIDILLENGAAPLAQIGNGQIFGELAFLDSTPRAASAVATQPSILLVIKRNAFNDLVEHEPHLGMVVMRNIAVELSNRLRKTNAAFAAARR